MRNDNVRVFFPVGHGGFSFERMDETTIVFDCGSRPKSYVEKNIMALKDELFDEDMPVIDHLFLSHFDEDHRNGLEQLLKTFEVKQIHLPYIDYRYRAAMAFLTDNGPVKLFNALIGNPFHSRISFYRNNSSKAYSIKSKHGRWEWVILNLLNEDFFEKVTATLKECGIEIYEQSDVDSESELVFNDGVEETQVAINQGIHLRRKENNDSKMTICAVTEVSRKTDGYIAKQNLEQSKYRYGYRFIDDKLGRANKRIADILRDIEKDCGHAKNEYGMLLLSKAVRYAEPLQVFFKQQTLDYGWWRPYRDWDVTSCLYTGDMSMTGGKQDDFTAIKALLAYNGSPLQFFQIPHHGSPHNSNMGRLRNIDSAFYFCYDKDCKRLMRNLANSQPSFNPINLPIILIDRDSEMDEVLHIS